MNAQGDEISYTIRSAREFLEAVPAVDTTSLLVDATRLPGETEKSRRTRVALLLSVLFDRYAERGRLTRDVHLLVNQDSRHRDRRGMKVRRLNPDGSPGRPLGRMVSPGRESYAAAQARRERTVSIRLGDSNRCPTCKRLVDEWWTMTCSRCDCGWSATGCLHCLSPEALACLDGRVQTGKGE